MRSTPVYDDTELWETRKLGATAKYARRVSAKREQAVDDALGLEVVTVRLEKEAAKKLKALAEKKGLAYQAYIRKIITRHLQQATKKSARCK